MEISPVVPHDSLRTSVIYGPVKSVKLLHKIFVDDIASTEEWNTFVKKLNSQLQDTNLLATVLLNANVGFLAIQSVDDSGGISIKQLASYMSLVASLSSIILGLVFVGHTRTETRNSAFQAANFLHRLQHETHGLETLAIIYSLPYALLLWGIVLFFAAFVSELSGQGDVTSWVSVGSFVFVVTLLVTWSIWTSRVHAPYWWFEPEPEQAEDRSVRSGTRVVNRSGRGRRSPKAPQEDDRVPKLGLLRRLIPPSWTRNRMIPVAETHAI
ncbi:hypothetical protein BU15DRAFT_76323 [Melanogaster broomeanus]|nr:hypothetical protein BU15DRAFT_76323 [Melanogaster broomeanus]